jgi:hypothetical protein
MTAALLVNGGFEAGETGWVDWGSSQNRGEVVRTDTMQCAGDWSVQMFDARSRLRSIHQDVGILGGAPYMLSVAVQTRNLGSDQAHVVIEWTDGGAVLAEDAIQIVPGTNPCTTYTAMYTAPAMAATARVRLLLGPVTDGVPRNDAEVWYDAVELVLQ